MGWTENGPDAFGACYDTVRYIMKLYRGELEQM